MGLFQSLEAGKRALMSHQIILSTIGQNIANVDTPGYSRQKVRISASSPLKTTLGMIGSGVEVREVRHVRDIFLGNQFRQENKFLGRWQYREKILSQVETMFSEPGGESLRSHVEDFFNSWSQLTNAPESATNRNDIVAKAVTITNDFRQLNARLNALRDSVDRDLAVRVRDVNQFSSEIVSLNKEIARIEVDGTNANDLRDRRDLLIDHLSGLVDVNVHEYSNGAVRVSIGGIAIVDGNEQYDVETRSATRQGKKVSILSLKGSTMEVKNLNGELRGLVESRDEMIPKYLEMLDELARGIAEEVNAIHFAGYGLRGPGQTIAPTGNNFFEVGSVGAASITVDSAILADVFLIAASKTGEPGDGSNALSMSQSRDTKLLSSGTLTFGNFYGAMVGGVGVEARQAIKFKENFELVLHQVENARQSVQGVSLDEEMTEMIKAQHAYNAAARVITAVDQALDTIIRGMGIVGR